MDSTEPQIMLASPQRNRGIWLLCGILRSASSCKPEGRDSPETLAVPRQPAAEHSIGTVVLDTATAPSLARSLYGHGERVPIAVYLPPGYAAASVRSFPVIYVLHGFPYTLNGQPVPEPHTTWLRGPFGVLALDSLIDDRAIRPVIVVVPEASSRFGAASFYTNSAAAGEWETFVARDLVRYVDRRYHTLRRQASRGVAGGSGGGYGALRLAMRHSDTFGAVYAQSPCCLGEGSFNHGEAEWRAALALTRPGQLPDTLHPIVNVLVGLAAAWSSESDKPPFYFEWPFQIQGNQLVPRQPAYGRWRANTILDMLPDHIGDLRRLRAIGFDVGRQDQYRFIPTTTQTLARELTRLGVAHRFEEYEGDHGSRRGERMVSRVLPFFDHALDFSGE